ncbi:MULTISPECIES: AMP-binding protein [Mycolicibacterium]|uniref:Long-chain-fatty-acid--CoA ligase FadD13 n=1 Tax=Mycolicibacterium senegalense TaxID=1796 RepID=A0A378T559_9MYCO|nr:MULTISPECIES: AMP-binding protein [Mycolicibacterium]MCV7336350.1 AMP-binding protein [Mycolicibacterium senegalense]MDR7290880.1 fatty-acyl-CoA synthase [Mycolicibacterium senegalense]QZA22429.1 AMP-binding protein [Mycolicibacterium senegalense]CDP83090.1 acyl-CoA synthetase [Mycolicibacterium farcinogenes]STZ55045.1 acyl-CoA synthetase [Mycolicibacterium senegalense]
MKRAIPRPAGLVARANRFRVIARSVAVLRESGLSGGAADGIRQAKLVRQFGGFAAVIESAAGRDPNAIAVTDEWGDVTFAQLNDRVNALARAWNSRGIGAGSVIAALCRDHRGLVTILAAAGKVGAQLLLMNTGFAKPQLADVATREKVNVLVYDEEFTDLVSAIDPGVRRFLAWTDECSSGDIEGSLEGLIAHTSPAPVAAPAKPGGMTLLTSGTTGTPKGAPRGKTSPLFSAQLLDRVPRRRGQTCMLAAPMFHGTGLGQAVLSLALGNRLVLRRKFNPEETLRAVQDHGCDVLVVVPTMLQRILALPKDVRDCYDTSSLKIIFVSGSAMPPDLVERTLDEFGPVLYNLYGSTELAVMTVAMPEDLLHDPRTAGRPPVGCAVRLYDEAGRQITEPGVIGRVFAGSDVSFAGYTDGRTKESINGLQSSGDVGHFDATGRLYIDGRDDDMVICGGENVYPLEVENLITSHPEVDEVAVIGVSDDDFGQRLNAYVVLVDGANLAADDIKDYVRANLARYKIPRDVEFLTKLPRNATGKVLRGELTGGAR